MGTCDTPFVQPTYRGAPEIVCPGGHHKFDSCLDEALWQLGMEDPTDSAGETDFEGHLSVVIVDEPEGVALDDKTPSARVVLVPVGNYLIWTASSGKVTVTTAASEAVARVMLGQVADRHALWEAGCDPDDPAGHEDCGDSCRRPEWIDA